MYKRQLFDTSETQNLTFLIFQNLKPNFLVSFVFGFQVLLSDMRGLDHQKDSRINIHVFSEIKLIYFKSLQIPGRNWTVQCQLPAIYSYKNGVGGSA